MKKNNFIILPTYNEASNIREIILEIFRLQPEIHVLVVDDNSPDGTANIVKDLQPKFSNLKLLEREKKEGLGKAYKAAFKMVLSQQEVGSIFMMDADFSHNPKYIEKMLDDTGEHSLIIGSRYTKDGGVEDWEMWRKFLSWGGNIYCRVIFRSRIKDWTAGFNCIDSSLLKKINLDKLDISGYSFLIGLKYQLVRKGAKVKEIPIIFENRRGGESKLSGHIVREGILTPWKSLLSK